MSVSTSVGITETRFWTLREPFRVQAGFVFPEITLAYEQYGEINTTADNVILVFHALTGSQHAAGENRQVPGLDGRWTPEVHTGWWDGFIGPGRALDTNQFAVICVNYLGGCYGSTGPASLNPQTGQRYASNFPALTLTDVVDTQIKLMDHLGVERLHAVVGGSVGGLACAIVATRYPERVRGVIPIAAGFNVTTLQILHNFEQIYAIVTDPRFQNGEYYDDPEGPSWGLSLGRMIGHKTFVSLEALEERASTEVIQPDNFVGYGIGHPLESYMIHHGQKFVRRFDANSYLALMAIWQRFNLLREVGGESLEQLLARCHRQRWMVFSIDSDVCFYPEEQAAMAAALNRIGVPVRRYTLHSEKGHDSFLLEPELYAPLLDDMLAS